MRWIKKLLLAILIVFVVIQFIQPARNENGQVLPTDITEIFSVPENVHTVFKAACYDCHSNNTNYPWYATIQPMGWQLDKHIRNGKADLNFSEFASYSLRRQISKLKAIENSIKDSIMPLSSYTMMHKNANLSKEDKALIIDWTEKTKDSLLTKK